MIHSKLSEQMRNSREDHGTAVREHHIHDTIDLSKDQHTKTRTREYSISYFRVQRERGELVRHDWTLWNTERAQCCSVVGCAVRDEAHRYEDNEKVDPVETFA